MPLPPRSTTRRETAPLAVSDADLARAAAQGDVGSLGALLQRHQAALLGTAVALVGRDDAEDAVHDSFLVAVREVRALRDPAAAGAWLGAIVRTQCLMRMRARRERPVADLHDLAGPASGGLPEAELERLALRDWVWSALERLSEPLRLAAMLRYFGSRASYEEIAAILDIPVGTVRSRLSQVRRRLADGLLEEARRAHPDVERRQAAGERLFRDAIAGANRGDLSGLADPMADDVVGIGRDEAIRGRHALVRALHDSTPAAGVRVHLDRVITSAAITVVEARFENPAEDPAHCPATTQVHFHPRGPTERILFAFAAREPAPAGAGRAGARAPRAPGTHPNGGTSPAV